MLSTTLPDRAEIARLTAAMLLEVEAVHIRPEDPFKLTSGMVSPVYIDCRRLISFPRVRTALTDFTIATLNRDAGFEAFDAIAGGETAGIPFAAWIADRLNLPMQYVRKKPKGFGRDAQIEGASVDGKRVLLVEDLATDGGSKLRFAQALRQAGADCAHTSVLFYYDIFEGGPQPLAEHGLRLHYLATWRDVLEAARAGGRFAPDTLTAVEAYLDAPRDWSAAHGGAAGI
ncbi:MAG: orotate phosphoribosyltransferase [Pseudomonadota bacterium]